MSGDLPTNIVAGDVGHIGDHNALHELAWDDGTNQLLLPFKEFTEAQLTALTSAPVGATARASDGIRGRREKTVSGGGVTTHMDADAIDIRADFDVTCDGTTDDADAVDAMLAALPNTPSGAIGFERYNVPVLKMPQLGTMRLTRQIVAPAAKYFGLRGAGPFGGRIVYEGTKTRADGSMTASSTTFTGSGFTSADVGSEFAVRGAGPGGATLVTWISGFTNSTTVTLAHAASTTVGPTATYVYQWCAFRFDSTTNVQPYSFENLVFHQGGLCFSSSQRPISVRRVNFFRTAGPAVTALDRLGAGGASLHIDGMWTMLCYGSVWHLASTYSISSYEHIRVLSSRDVSICLDANGHVVRDVDFQGMDDAVGSFLPHLQLRSQNDFAGFIDIEKVRFGVEAGTHDGVAWSPPREQILLGNVGTVEATAATNTPVHIRLRAVEFLGRSTPTSTSAKHAIKMNRRPAGLSIAESWFAKHDSALIQEDWVTALSGATLEQVRQSFVFEPSNTIDVTHIKDIFSAGGYGWEPKPLAQRRSSAWPWQKTQNLLGNSNLFSSGWTFDDVTVAQDVTGPDGVANSAWTITRSVGSSSGVSFRQTNIQGYVVGEPLVLSFWAKAGTNTIITPHVNAVVGANGQGLAEFVRPIVLSTRWERYEIRCAPVPTGTTSIQVFIFHGRGSTSLDSTDGTTFLFTKAQLEVGLAASAYIENDTLTKHDPLPFQGLTLGTRRITYGLAANTPTGQNRQGDLYFYTDTITAGRLGKACTVSGSPGTWVEFGSIGATGAAYTQTFATADRTHAARTAVALTDNSGGTASDTIVDVPAAYDEATFANIVASLVRAINRNRADALDTAEVTNALVDDLQGQGQVG